jgi:ribosomal protein L20A (L18A)
MAKFRVRYTRGSGEREFETIVEVNAFTRNQAMVRIKENVGAYKDLNFNDVKILNVEKVESWQQ